MSIPANSGSSSGPPPLDPHERDRLISGAQHVAQRARDYESGDAARRGAAQRVQLTAAQEMTSIENPSDVTITPTTKDDVAALGRTPEAAEVRQRNTQIMERITDWVASVKRWIVSFIHAVKDRLGMIDQDKVGILIEKLVECLRTSGNFDTPYLFQTRTSDAELNEATTAGGEANLLLDRILTNDFLARVERGSIEELLPTLYQGLQAGDIHSNYLAEQLIQRLFQQMKLFQSRDYEKLHFAASRSGILNYDTNEFNEALRDHITSWAPHQQNALQQLLNLFAFIETSDNENDPSFSRPLTSTLAMGFAPYLFHLDSPVRSNPSDEPDSSAAISVNSRLLLRHLYNHREEIFEE